MTDEEKVSAHQTLIEMLTDTLALERHRKKQYTPDQAVSREREIIEIRAHAFVKLVRTFLNESIFTL